MSETATPPVLPKPEMLVEIDVIVALPQPDRHPQHPLTAPTMMQ